MYIARSRGRQASFAQLFIDYLRKYYGNTRSYRGCCESFEKHVRVSIVDEKSSDFIERNDFSFGNSASGLSERELSAWGDRIFMGERDAKIKKVWDLCIEDNYSQKEAGEIINISSSRVSQIITKIKKTLTELVILDEIASEYACCKEKSEIKINWIKI